MAIVKKQGCLAVCLIGLLVLGGTRSVGAQGSNRKTERVLIELSKPYDRVTAAVKAMGGRVTHQYKYVDAIAAEIPVDALESVRSQIGSAAMYKDVEVTLPKSVAPGHGRTVNGVKIGAVYSAGGMNGGPIPATAIPAYAATHPGAYVLNFAGDRLDQVHARGYTGAGTIVAVIDSGIRPGFTGLGNSILGGEDFVGDGLGYSNQANDPHGTFVAGMISNNATFNVSGALKNAIAAYAPDALSNGKVVLLGAAPESKIYALRVFGANASSGTTVSLVLAAMQRVIDLRLAYNHGVAGGIKIEVCNMSFGVMTLNAGRSLLDRSADMMLAAGVIPVAASGDAGTATLTVGSPGSSRSSLTVGASSSAANERIANEVLYGVPGLGAEYRPFSGTQTAWFSSRGPNADGRPSPDIVAAGVFDFSQGYCSNGPVCPNEIALNSGTSFSAPIASGIAAVLRQAFPHASAVEIRNALAMTGRAGQIQDGSDALDRGTGLIDAVGAFNLLASGRAPDKLPSFPKPSSDVRENVERNTDLRVFSRNVTKTISNLRPGQRVDLLFDVAPDTAAVTVKVTRIQPSLPPGQQNPFFGDGLYVDIHSAKTSSIGAYGDYLAFDSPRSDATYVVTDPDTGLMRISINGDTVNAGNVSATIKITETIETLPRVSVRGTVRDGETLALPLSVPAGTDRAEFLLSWGDDWSHYPTADIDLYLVPPVGDPITLGSTLAGPERVTVTNPVAGNWTVLIDGFNIPAGQDRFKLRVLFDGVVVR